MSANESTAWIRLSDLAESEVWISVINTTTRVPVPETAKVELIGVSKREVILTLPKTSCALGHLLSLQIRQVETLDFTAKVIEEESLDSISKTVTLTLYQHDEQKWGEFLRAIDDRQQKLNRIVANING